MSLFIMGLLHSAMCDFKTEIQPTRDEKHNKKEYNVAVKVKKL